MCKETIKIELVKLSWKNQDVEELKKYLVQISEEKYRDFHSRLVPNCDKILGIRVPVLRKISTEICKGNYQGFLEVVDDEFYETTMLQGLVIGKCKSKPDEKMDMLKKFVPKIDNWAVCDSTCTSLKFVNKNMQEFLKFIQRYINSNSEFEIRFAVVCLMIYYINEEYIDYVLETLKSIKDDRYYVKMAVAWALSVCYVKFEDKTLKALLSDELDKDTLRKSFQKIVESNRVDKEKKEYIRSLRKSLC